MHELSTDSEVTFSKVLGSVEVLPTRPGVDPLEVTGPLPDSSRTPQSPITASPSVIARLGMQPPAASYYVFGPQPDIWSTPDQATTANLEHREDPKILNNDKKRRAVSLRQLSFLYLVSVSSHDT